MNPKVYTKWEKARIIISIAVSVATPIALYYLLYVVKP
jgi:hypothetical protein